MHPRVAYCIQGWLSDGMSTEREKGKGIGKRMEGGTVRTELPTGRSGRIGIGILIVAIKPNYVDNGRHGERPFRDRTIAAFTEFNGRVINKGMRIAGKSSPSGSLATASLSHLDIRSTPTNTRRIPPCDDPENQDRAAQWMRTDVDDRFVTGRPLTLTQNHRKTGIMDDGRVHTGDFTSSAVHSVPLEIKPPSKIRLTR